MANTPRKSQDTNPLADFPSNLDEPAPMAGITPAELQAALDEAYARGRQDSAVGIVAKPDVEIDMSATAHISSSGKAPKVDAKDRVWITLDDNDEIAPGGLFVGLNGVGYQLLPGTEMHVQRALLEVLDNAVKSVPVQDPVSKRIVGWKERKRFSYSIINKGATHAA